MTRYPSADAGIEPTPGRFAGHDEIGATIRLRRVGMTANQCSSISEKDA